MSYPPPPGLNGSSSSAPTPPTHGLPPRPSGPPPSLRAYNAASTGVANQSSSSSSAGAFAFRPRQVAAPPIHSAPPSTYSSGYSQPGYGAAPSNAGYGGMNQYHTQQQVYAQAPPVVATAPSMYGAPQHHGYPPQHQPQQAYHQPQTTSQHAPIMPTTTTPHIVNPFPLPGQQAYGQSGGGAGSFRGGRNQPFDPRYPPLDPELEAQIAQQQSIYIPQDQQNTANKDKRTVGGATVTGSNNAPLGPLNPALSGSGGGTDGGSHHAGPGGKEKAPTVIRHGGGQTWQDSSLLEWDPAHFRLFVGNLAGEVTDESLLKAFSKYPSVQKARVIRDKRTTKSKGYGFVSFSDGDEYFRAAREMNGKYIGSHPVLLKRSNTEIRPVMPGDKKNKKGGGHGGGGGNAGTNAGIKKKKKQKVPERKVLG